MLFLTQRRKGAKAQSDLSCLASLRLGDFALKSLLYPRFNFFGCEVAALPRCVVFGEKERLCLEFSKTPCG